MLQLACSLYKSERSHDSSVSSLTLESCDCIFFIIFFIFYFLKAFIELVCVAASVNHRLLRPDCQSADLRAARDSAVPTLCSDLQVT